MIDSNEKPTGKEQADESLNKDHLFRLYEIAIEEARHHERLSLQLWAALAVFFGLFVAGVFYFNQSIADSIGRLVTWLGTSIIGSVFLVVCMLVIYTFDETAYKCRDIVSNIEYLLSVGNKEQRFNVELKKLLIFGRIKLITSPSLTFFWGRQLSDRIFRLFMLCFPMVCLWGILFVLIVL